MAYIKKITLPTGSTYDIFDEKALHDASAFDVKGAAAGALTEAKSYTDGKIAGLGAVLNFKGTKDSASKIFNLTDSKKGDVWLVASSDADNGKEYVYINDTAGQTGAANWEMFGVSTSLEGLVTKAQHNAHTHDVTVTGQNGSSSVSGTASFAANKVLTGKTVKHLTASASGVAVSGTGADKALGENATFTTTVTPSKANLKATITNVGVSGSGSDKALGEATTFSVTGGALTGATQASFDTAKFHGGTATTPAVIDTTKFNGGRVASWTGASAANWDASVDDDGVMSFSWTANNLGTFDGGSVASINDGFYTAGSKGTPASIDSGIFTPNVVGSVSTIGVSANDTDIVDVISGVSVSAQPTVALTTVATAEANKTVEVATGISSSSTAVANKDAVDTISGVSVTAQPSVTLSAADASSTGSVQFVSDNASLAVDGTISGTAAAQSWTQVTGVSDVPKTPLS